MAQPRMQRRRSGTMRPGDAALFLLCVMVAGATNPALAASQYDSTHDACSVAGGCSVTQAAGEASIMPPPMPCMGMHEELPQAVVEETDAVLIRTRHIRRPSPCRDARLERGIRAAARREPRQDHRPQLHDPAGGAGV